MTYSRTAYPVFDAARMDADKETTRRPIAYAEDKAAALATLRAWFENTGIPGDAVEITSVELGERWGVWGYFPVFAPDA